MKDLIDRWVAYAANESLRLSEAIKALQEKTSIQAVLRWLPSAQPEIIRCKDCENWIPGYITDNDDFIPPKCGKYQQMVGHSSNDYCSFAERREDVAKGHEG